jgi:hypothetical protein
MESFAPAKDAVKMENIGLCPGKKECRQNGKYRALPRQKGLPSWKIELCSG